MDKQQIEKIRDYVFTETWTQHNKTCSLCDDHDVVSPLIDLPVGDLNREEREEAKDILARELKVYVCIAQSQFMGNVAVLRIFGEAGIEKAKKHHPPLHIALRPEEKQKADFKQCRM